jgi:hypothetical protein
MHSNIRSLLGIALMAGCGSAISTHFGFDTLLGALLAGFGVGIVFIGQAPVLALQKRVSLLEAQLRSSGKTVV